MENSKPLSRSPFVERIEAKTGEESKDKSIERMERG